MSKQRSRPQNNDHCFTGVGRNLWRERARGMALAKDGLKNTHDGYQLDYRLDVDNAVFQTGGILNPQEIKLRPAVYYRFISTREHSLHGAARGIYGNWWLSADHHNTLAVLADQNNDSLAEFAAQALYIPPGWGDCGYVIRARLDTTLRAWAGPGKIASEGLSATLARGDANTPVTYGIPGVSENILQLFIPEPYSRDNSGKNLLSFFSLISCDSAWTR